MSTIDWPLDLNQIRRGLTNHTFGMVRRNADGTPRPHQGWDFHALVGTPCHAIADGVIAMIGNGGAYGLTIVQKFEHKGQALYAAYCHMQTSKVYAGDEVKLGQVIGLTGESGNAKGMGPKDQHLHFEIRTVPMPGRGLVGRLSPLTVFGACPLREPVRRGKVAA